METDDDSNEGADVEASLSSELVSGVGVGGHSAHHKVRDVGELGHQKEEILLHVLGDLVGSADVDLAAEAEVGQVRNGVDVASREGASDRHNVSNQAHHLAHIEFHVHDKSEELYNLFLGGLAQAGILNLVQLVETLLETVVETTGTLEIVVDDNFRLALPNS